jgi:hypothetical protein
VVRDLKEGELEWQSECDASTKGETTKSFFPIIKDRISKSLHMGINLSTIVTGHGILRSYYHRFKIIGDPKCACKMDSDHSKEKLSKKYNEGRRRLAPNQFRLSKQTYEIVSKICEVYKF